MSGPPARELEGAGESPEVGVADAADVPTLEQEGDVETLLALALAYRAGSDGLERDLARCFECFEAAARLGDAGAQFATAAFLMSGGVVERDVPAGVGLLREAAGQGHLEARIYLGNVYELGLHHDADPDKADVWYRSAARAAGVEDAPDSDAHVLAMAALGSARAVMALLADASVPKKDKLEYLRKAKPLGYGEFLRQRDRASRDASDASDPDDAGRATEELLAEAERDRREALAGRGEKKAARVDRALAAADDEVAIGDDEHAARSAERPRWTVGAGAFALAVTLGFFAAAGVVGWLAAAGATAMVAGGGALPVLGVHVELVLPLALALFGVLPTFFLYRAKTVLFGLANAAAMGGLGFFLWETHRILLDRVQQSTAFAVVGFLVVLLVLGLRGGVKARAADTPKSAGDGA